MAERLYRSREDRMLAGVAGGVAEALDADPSLVRIVWALLVIFTGGIAFLVYIVMAIVVPVAPEGWETGAGRGGWVGGPSVGGPSVGGPSVGGPSAGGTPSEPEAANTPGDAPDQSPGTAGAAAPAGFAASSWQAEREARRASRRARRAESDGRGGLIAGLILIVIGAFFLLRQFGMLFAWDLWWPVALIGVGVLLLVFALFPNRPTE